MKENKKRPEAKAEHATSPQNRKRASVSDSSDQADSNMSYFKYVYDLIPTGRRKAIRMSELATLLTTNERQTRKIVSDMRASGFLICGDQCGYYRPATSGELKVWYRLANARIETTVKGLRHAEEVLEKRGISGVIE